MSEQIQQSEQEVEAPAELSEASLEEVAGGTLNPCRMAEDLYHLYMGTEREYEI